MNSLKINPTETKVIKYHYFFTFDAVVIVPSCDKKEKKNCGGILAPLFAPQSSFVIALEPLELKNVPQFKNILFHGQVMFCS